MHERPTEAGKRLKLAAEMADAGVAMLRESLKRRFPSESDAEIEARVVAILVRRPGAAFGDGPGRIGRWPRH